MPKGPPPPWTSKDCRFDHLVAAAIDHGIGQPLTYNGITSPERAKDIKNGFYRCCRHRHVSGWVTWIHGGEETTKSVNWPPDKQPDGTYTLTLNTSTKSQARKRHIAKYGTDRSAWPYNPRRGKSAEDIAAWADRGLDEKGHRRK